MNNGFSTQAVGLAYGPHISRNHYAIPRQFQGVGIPGTGGSGIYGGGGDCGTVTGGYGAFSCDSVGISSIAPKDCDSWCSFAQHHFKDQGHCKKFCSRCNSCDAHVSGGGAGLYGGGGAGLYGGGGAGLYGGGGAGLYGGGSAGLYGSNSAITVGSTAAPEPAPPLKNCPLGPPPQAVCIFDPFIIYFPDPPPTYDLNTPPTVSTYNSYLIANTTSADGNVTKGEVFKPANAHTNMFGTPSFPPGEDWGYEMPGYTRYAIWPALLYSGSFTLGMVTSSPDLTTGIFGNYFLRTVPITISIATAEPCVDCTGITNVYTVTSDGTVVFSATPITTAATMASYPYVVLNVIQETWDDNKGRWNYTPPATLPGYFDFQNVTTKVINLPGQ